MPPITWIVELNLKLDLAHNIGILATIYLLLKGFCTVLGLAYDHSIKKLLAKVVAIGTTIKQKN